MNRHLLQHNHTPDAVAAVLALVRLVKLSVAVFEPDTLAPINQVHPVQAPLVS